MAPSRPSSSGVCGGSSLARTCSRTSSASAAAGDLVWSSGLAAPKSAVTGPGPLATPEGPSFSKRAITSSRCVSISGGLHDFRLSSVSCHTPPTVSSRAAQEAQCSRC